MSGSISLFHLESGGMDIPSGCYEVGTVTQVAPGLVGPAIKTRVACMACLLQ